MKPPPFRYQAADSVDEALSWLARHGSEAKLLAGGQSLIPVMSFRLARPSVLVDLNRIPGLDFVRETEDGELAVGALTRQRRLERDPVTRRLSPLLAETLPFVAHPQIRNRGTVGGSLAHADPAAELPAVALALDARLRLVSERGARWLAARDFFAGLFATALAPDEMLAEVRFPRLPARTGCAFGEIARRHGDYAQAGAAVVVTLAADGTIERARLAYLALGEGPLEAPRAAAVLDGAAPSEALFAEAAEVALGEVDPTSDVHATEAYKRHLAQVLTRRLLATAVARAAEGGA